MSNKLSGCQEQPLYKMREPDVCSCMTLTWCRKYVQFTSRHEQAVGFINGCSRTGEREAMGALTLCLRIHCPMSPNKLCSGKMYNLQVTPVGTTEQSEWPSVILTCWCECEITPCEESSCFIGFGVKRWVLGDVARPKKPLNPWGRITVVGRAAKGASTSSKKAKVI